MKTQYSINPDADTIEELQDYVNCRNLQLGKFGFTLRTPQITEYGIVCGYDSPKYGNHYGAIFLLKSARSQGIYLKLLQQSQIAVVTLEECGIESYLQKIKCNYLCFRHSDAYKLIQGIYKDDRAKRSGVPLIYHIDEGCTLLDRIGASNLVKDAFCLHPVLQSDEAFSNNRSLNFGNIPTEAIILAMEYRRAANSYLSTMPIENFVGFSCEEVKDMLMADKVQNYKDFMKYHYGTHPRSGALYNYFHNWFNLLNIEYTDENG